ncbi:FecR domain-containing protein [Campylobacterota bacterium DY0563]
MNKKNYTIISILLIICIIGFVYYKIEYSNNIFAQVVSKIGKVNLVDKNGKILSEVQEGYKIKTGEILETKENSSATLKFIDNSIAIISEKSLVSIKELKYNKESKQSITNILLLKGKVESDVIDQETFGSEYKVTTPTLQLAVRGTIFNVDVGDTETKAYVTEGKILVSNDKSSLILNAGYGIVVDESNELGSPISLLGKPIIDLNELDVKYYKKYLLWQELENAVKYHVQIYSTSKYKTLVYDKYTNDNELNIDSLENGKYKINVIAVDKYGLEGFKLEEYFDVNSNPLPPLVKAPKLNEKSKKILFSWEKSSEANKYVLEISKTKTFEKVLIRVNNLNSSLNKISLPLQKGEYFIRMASIDIKNKKGPYSQGYQFKVEKK